MAFEDVALDAMRGVGLWKGLGTSGLRRAQLNFIKKNTVGSGSERLRFLLGHHNLKGQGNV